MAEVIVSLRIMPSSPEENLDILTDKATAFITDFKGEVHSTKQVDVAFGLKSINIIFIMDEAIGSTEKLENQISETEGVNSCEVTDVRRALG